MPPHKKRRREEKRQQKEIMAATAVLSPNESSREGREYCVGFSAY
jgi:hypothetical protein